MKTVINAKIMFETDRYNSLSGEDPNSIVLTISDIADILRNGDYELLEVLRNKLMCEQELYLVIRHEPKGKFFCPRCGVEVEVK